MKKFIKVILCLLLIGINVGVEFYPTGKVLIKRHLAEVDFEKAISMNEISKTISFLSHEEKKSVVKLLEDLYNSQTK